MPTTIRSVFLNHLTNGLGQVIQEIILSNKQDIQQFLHDVLHIFLCSDEEQQVKGFLFNWEIVFLKAINDHVLVFLHSFEVMAYHLLQGFQRDKPGVVVFVSKELP